MFFLGNLTRDRGTEKAIETTDLLGALFNNLTSSAASKINARATFTIIYATAVTPRTKPFHFVFLLRVQWNVVDSLRKLNFSFIQYKKLRLNIIEKFIKDELPAMRLNYTALGDNYLLRLR